MMNRSIYGVLGLVLFWRIFLQFVSSLLCLLLLLSPECKTKRIVRKVSKLEILRHRGLLLTRTALDITEGGVWGWDRLIQSPKYLQLR